MIISIPINPTLVKQKLKPYISKLIWLPQILAGIGIVAGFGNWLLPATPVLLFGFSLMILTFSSGNQKQKLSYFFIFALSGFILELIGVQTGVIFGHYSYGENLGLKLSGVPLVIGLNWAMLIFTANILVNRLRIPLVLRSLIAAILLVLLDLIMEQSAGILDFWHFKNGLIPWINYCSWFLIAFAMSLVFQKKFSKVESSLASHLYFSQIVFFSLVFLGQFI